MTFPFWRGQAKTPLSAASYAEPAASLAPADAASGEEPSLIAAAQRGDRDAFDALCARHLPLLRGFVARRVATDLVDDVVQEALLGAWMRIGHYEPTARFKTWLYQIALHKSIDANRARERKGRHEQSVEGTDEVRGAASSQSTLSANRADTARSPFPRPGDQLEAEERRAAILQALEKIPAGQREVVLLYFYAEMTLPEIAQATGRNLSTVKYQFYAAHVKIADLLAGTPWAVPQKATGAVAVSPEKPRPSARSASAGGEADFSPLGRKVRAGL